MKVVRDDLPVEGIKIGGILFKSAKIMDVDKKLGDVLVKRKGFIEIKGVKRDGKTNRS